MRDSDNSHTPENLLSTRVSGGELNMTEPDPLDDVLPLQRPSSAIFSGSGAIACGDQAKVTDERSVVADEIHGPVVTGDRSVVGITDQGVPH
jgi:hypothetical protein